MKLLFLFLLYKIFIDNTRGEEVNCIGPEYCEAKPGDVLNIECTYVGMIELDDPTYENDTIHWKFVEGKIENASQSYDEETSTLQIKLPFKKEEKNLKIACYGNKEIFYTKSTEDLIIKINHDDKRKRIEELMRKENFRKEISKLFISACVILFLDIFSVIIFLMILLKYKRLKDKEKRKKVLRELIEEAEETLSQIELAKAKKKQAKSTQTDKVNKNSTNKSRTKEKSSENLRKSNIISKNLSSNGN